jgi:hypothetical protein
VDKVISTILKHDSKVTSYKIALLRAINDTVLAYPDLRAAHKDVAIPLRLLAQHWVAYYWPFVDSATPIYQGPRARLGDEIRNDMAFRPQLTALRNAWVDIIGGSVRASDGFFLVNELRVPRRRDSYPRAFLAVYWQALKKTASTIEMPIRYAGPGEWTVFARPRPLRDLSNVIAVPGSDRREKCLVIPNALWLTFRRLSLWVEALCIHEWSLFTEGVDQGGRPRFSRGDTYTLLTDRPDNRRPLTWERNRIDLLLMEGEEFVCPWTQRRIHKGTAYDLDHIVPVSIYPTNELWNLVPSEPDYNSHEKRDRLPEPARLDKARPYLTHTYSRYEGHADLSTALHEDVAVRFSAVSDTAANYPVAVTESVIDLVNQIADARNLARF